MWLTGPRGWRPHLLFLPQDVPWMSYWTHRYNHLLSEKGFQDSVVWGNAALYIPFRRLTAFNEVVRVLRSYAGINLYLCFIWCFQIYLPHLRTGFCMGFPGGSDSKVSARNAGDPDSVSGLGRSPGEGNGNPVQYSCLENSSDRGAWLARVHGFAESRTWLSNCHFSLSYRSRIYPSQLQTWQKSRERKISFIFSIKRRLALAE